MKEALVKSNYKYQLSYHFLLDTTGLNCPLPVLKTKQALKNLEKGQILYLISTDQNSLKDISKFCAQFRYQLLDSSEKEKKYCFYIQK